MCRLCATDTLEVRRERHRHLTWKPRVIWNCSICGRPGYAKGLCASHYEQKRLGRTPAHRQAPTCVVPGCYRDSYCKDRCQKHYRRMWRRERSAA